MGEMEELLERRLAGFASDVLRALWDGYDLDGEEIQKLGLKHKLIHAVAFDPAKHTDHLGVGAEAGDEWFEEDRALRALIKEKTNG